MYFNHYYFCKLNDTVNVLFDGINKSFPKDITIKYNLCRISRLEMKYMVYLCTEILSCIMLDGAI